MTGPVRSRGGEHQEEDRDDLGSWHSVACLLPLDAVLWGLIAGAALRWLG